MQLTYEAIAKATGTSLAIHEPTVERVKPSPALLRATCLEAGDCRLLLTLPFPRSCLRSIAIVAAGNMIYHREDSLLSAFCAAGPSAGRWEGVGAGAARGGARVRQVAGCRPGEGGVV